MNTGVAQQRQVMGTITVIETSTPDDGDFEELSVRLIINDRNEKTNGRKVVLTMLSNSAKQMRLRNDGEDWIDWQPYSSHMEWDLRDVEGKRTVYVEVKDKHENVASAEDSIIYEKYKEKEENRGPIFKGFDLIPDKKDFLVGETILLILDGDDPDGDILTYIFEISRNDDIIHDFDDTNWQIIYDGLNPTFEFQFQEEGYYRIQGTISDGESEQYANYGNIFVGSEIITANNGVRDYDISKDTFRFNNFGWEYYPSIDTALEEMTSLFADVIIGEDIGIIERFVEFFLYPFIKRSGTYGGHCAGIATAASIYFSNPELIPGNAKNINDLNPEDCPDIKIYFVRTNTVNLISNQKMLTKIGFHQDEEYQKLVDFMNSSSNNNPGSKNLGVIGINYHSVNVFKIIKTKKRAYFFIYDNNDVGGKVRYAMLNLETWEFKYQYYDTSFDRFCFLNPMKKTISFKELSGFVGNNIKNFGIISNGSPADLHIYDSEGRHIGLNYITNRVEIEIPNASYEKVGHVTTILIPNASENYSVELRGNDDGIYHLMIDLPMNLKNLEEGIDVSRIFVPIEGDIGNNQTQTLYYDTNQLAFQVSEEVNRIIQERDLASIDESTMQQIINEAIQEVVNNLDSDGDGIPDIEDRTPIPSKFDWRRFTVVNIRKYSSFMLIFLVIGIMGILGTFAYSRIGKTTRVQVPGFGEIGTLRPIPREAQLIVSGNKFWIEKSYITIGRGVDADIKITDSDRLISDIHAKVYRDKTGQYWVEDNSSANGTFIHRNGKYIEMKKWALYDGDKIGLCYDLQRKKVIPIIFRVTRESEKEIDGKMFEEAKAKIIVEGRRISLIKESMTIGKGEEADVRITDSSIAVSEIHARIFRDETGHYWVEDKNSKNGTFIYLFGEYRRIKMWRLYDGDVVGLCYDPVAGKQFPIIFERSKRYERRFLKSSISWDIFSES